MNKILFGSGLRVLYVVYVMRSVVELLIYHEAEQRHHALIHKALQALTPKWFIQILYIIQTVALVMIFS